MKTQINLFIYGLFFYLLTLVLATALFTGKIISPTWLLGQTAVISYFFIGVIVVFNLTVNLNPNRFVKSIVLVNVIVKFGALLISYFYFKDQFGIGIINDSDYHGYYKTSTYLAKNLNQLPQFINSTPMSDIGAYAYFVSIYYIFGDNIFITGLVTLLFATHSVVLMYKIVRQINTELIAKLTAIVMSLIPILNYHIGLHLKDLFFIWIVLVGVYNLYKVFLNMKLSFWRLLIILTSIISLFFFRTVVALVFIMSIGSLMLLSKSIKLHLVYKILTIVLLLASLLMLFFLSSASEEVEKYYNTTENTQTLIVNEVNETRGEKSLASSFLGLPSQIFMSINSPYPTLIDNNLPVISKITRYSQIADGFIKAFLAFFFFLSFIDISFLRRNIFMSSFIIVYIVVLAIGGMSLLYRMFFPVLPIFIYFAVAQFSKINKVKYLYFILYLVMMIAIYLYFNHIKMIDYNLY